MKAPLVSVIIKALNEERNIARTIESVLRAVDLVGGEVILADSCSSDRTVEIASAYPVVIVELANPTERCCGIGPQLGFQHARGEYIYVIDGDMVMYEDFLPKALALLQADSQLAGVAGLVVEKNLDSLEYRMRVERAPTNIRPGTVDRLDGGGLYRRRAIDQIGYLTDRNLHSYEEFDLGIRLRANGWTLQRIDAAAVDHYGHQIDAVTLLMRRWRNGYVWGIGEVVRASLGQPQARLLVRELRELHLYLAVLGWWLVLMLFWLLPLPLMLRAALFVATLVAPFLVMVVRKRSVVAALYSMFAWTVAAAGLVRGFMRPRASASSPIASQRRSSTLAD